MKNFCFLLVFLLIPLFTQAEILVKVGILDMDKLIEDFPESKEIKANWDTLLSKKYYLIDLYEKEYQFLNQANVSETLSEKSAREFKRFSVKKNIESLKTKKKIETASLESTKGKELKLKIFKAIKDARRKTGFGIILSSKEDFILYYSKNMHFNPMVIEELMPADKNK